MKINKTQALKQTDNSAMKTHLFLLCNGLQRVRNEMLSLEKSAGFSHTRHSYNFATTFFRR